MNYTVTIQISQIGTGAGPFDIYYDSQIPENLLVTGIISQELLVGYEILNVPDTATSILLVDTGICNDVFTYSIVQPTPSPTSTVPTTPSSTPTQTQTPNLTSSPTTTPTPTNTQTPTQTLEVTPTPTPTTTLTPSITPSNNPTPSVTRSPAPTPQPTKTPTTTPTLTPSSTSTVQPIFNIFAATNREFPIYEGTVFYSVNDVNRMNFNSLGMVTGTTFTPVLVSESCNLGDTIRVFGADYTNGVQVISCYLSSSSDTCLFSCNTGSYIVTLPVTNIYVVLRVTPTSEYLYCL